MVGMKLTSVGSRTNPMLLMDWDGLGWLGMDWGSINKLCLSVCKTCSFFSHLHRVALAVIIVSVCEAKVWQRPTWPRSSLVLHTSQYFFTCATNLTFHFPISQTHPTHRVHLNYKLTFPSQYQLTSLTTISVGWYCGITGIVQYQ